MRVLMWILGRCDGSADAMETPIGFEPKPEDIETEGSGLTAERIAELLTVDKDLWKEEAAGIEEFYKKFGDKLPKELSEELETLKKNLE